MKYAKTSLLAAMGQHKHHRHRRQLRVWQDFVVPRDRDCSEPAMGGDPVNGTTRRDCLVEPTSNTWKDSFYKVLTKEQSDAAFRNEYDFDSPKAIDFDFLVNKLGELRQGKKTDIPVYLFQKHSRLDKTNTIYSPHVLILEGIFALHDQRVLDMLDLKVRRSSVARLRHG